MLDKQEKYFKNKTYSSVHSLSIAIRKMSKILNFLLILLLIHISTQFCGASHFLIDELAPTPNPLGKQCDEKISRAPGFDECVTGSDSSFIDGVFQKNVLEIRANIALNLLSENGIETDCCDFWRFFKCYKKFSLKVCTETEAQALGVFIKNYVIFLETNRCKDKPFLRSDLCPESKPTVMEDQSVEELID
jgi:hypothetical protein